MPMANALRSCEESDSSQVFISAHQLAKIVAGFYEFHAQSPFMRESIEFLKGRGVIANKDAKFIEDSFIVMGKGTKQLCSTGIPTDQQSSIADADHNLHLSILWQSAPPFLLITSHSTNIRYETIRDAYRYRGFATGDRNFLDLVVQYADPILEAAFGQYKNE